MARLRSGSLAVNASMTSSGKVSVTAREGDAYLRGLPRRTGLGIYYVNNTARSVFSNNKSSANRPNTGGEWRVLLSALEAGLDRVEPEFSDPGVACLGGVQTVLADHR